MAIKAGISGLAYTVGAKCPISDLILSEQAPEKTIANLQARGMLHYRHEQRPVTEILWEIASECLLASDVHISEVDGILMVNSPIEEAVLIRTLNEAGFHRPWLLGLNFQDCGGTEAALRIANDLVLGGGRTRRLLVFLYGKVPTDESRIGWEGETVFSDGALACLVSPQSSGLQIVASEVLTNTKLAWFRDMGAQAKYLDECLSTLRAVTGQVLASAGIKLADIQRVFATNGNRSYHNIMSSTLGISHQAIHASTMSEYGHVFSCDALIGLKDHIASQKPDSGTYFLLLSWSPYVIGASVLQYV